MLEHNPHPLVLWEGPKAAAASIQFHPEQNIKSPFSSFAHPFDSKNKEQPHAEPCHVPHAVPGMETPSKYRMHLFKAGKQTRAMMPARCEGKGLHSACAKPQPKGRQHSPHFGYGRGVWVLFLIITHLGIMSMHSLQTNLFRIYMTSGQCCRDLPGSLPAPFPAGAGTFLNTPADVPFPKQQHPKRKALSAPGASSPSRETGQ